MTGQSTKVFKPQVVVPPREVADITPNSNVGNND